VTPEPVRQPEQASGVLVTAGARELCRAVGTTAWAVLCDLALDAEADAEADAEGRLVAATNVRRIADHLGISKDTAARALGRLGDAGLVGRQSAPRQSGRFMASDYVVRLGAGAGVALLAGRSCPVDLCPVSTDTAVAPDNGDASSSARRRSSRPPSSRRWRTPAEQASLFPADRQLADAR
jgi:hypothetical protein